MVKLFFKAQILFLFALQFQLFAQNYFDQAKEFPPYIELLYPNFKSMNAEAQEKALNEAMALRDKVHKAAFERLTLPIMAEGDEKPKMVPFFTYIQDIAKKIGGENTELLPSGGVVRSQDAYIYHELNLAKKAGQDPRALMEQFAKGEFTLEGSRKDPYGKTIDQLPAFYVRGVGSDVDVLLRGADSGEAAAKITREIKKITESAEQFYQAEGNKSAVKKTLFPIGDVKHLDEQIADSVKSGGSSIDWMVFSLKEGRTILPPQHKYIVKEMLQGVYRYVAGENTRADKDKQVIRGFRALFEMPWMRIKEETQLRKEIAELKAKVEKAGTVHNKVIEQYQKLVRNARDEAGHNLMYRARPGSIEKEIRELSDLISRKTGKATIPEFAERFDLSRKSNIDQKYLIQGDALGKEVKGMVLYHGTPEMNNAMAMMRGGMFISRPGNEHMARQGTAAYGKGTYSSPNKSTALGYMGSGGITFELKIKEGARVLDWATAQNDNKIKAKLKEFGESPSAPVKTFSWLAAEEGIDIIKNGNYIIQNAEAVEMPKTIGELVNAFKSVVENPDSGVIAKVSAWKDHKRFYAFAKALGENNVVAPHEKIPGFAFAVENTDDVGIENIKSMISDDIWRVHPAAANEMSGRFNKIAESPNSGPIAKVTAWQDSKRFYAFAKVLGEEHALRPHEKIPGFTEAFKGAGLNELIVFTEGISDEVWQAHTQTANTVGGHFKTILTDLETSPVNRLKAWEEHKRLYKIAKSRGEAALNVPKSQNYIVTELLSLLTSTKVTDAEVEELKEILLIEDELVGQMNLLDLWDEPGMERYHRHILEPIHDMNTLEKLFSNKTFSDEILIFFLRRILAVPSELSDFQKKMPKSKTVRLQKIAVEKKADLEHRIEKPKNQNFPFTNFYNAVATRLEHTSPEVLMEAASVFNRSEWMIFDQRSGLRRRESQQVSQLNSLNSRWSKWAFLNPKNISLHKDEIEKMLLDNSLDGDLIHHSIKNFFYIEKVFNRIGSEVRTISLGRPSGALPVRERSIGTSIFFDLIGRAALSEQQVEDIGQAIEGHDISISISELLDEWENPSLQRYREFVLRSIDIDAFDENIRKKLFSMMSDKKLLQHEIDIVLEKMDKLIWTVNSDINPDKFLLVDVDLFRLITGQDLSFEAIEIINKKLEHSPGLVMKLDLIEYWSFGELAPYRMAILTATLDSMKSKVMGTYGEYEIRNESIALLRKILSDDLSSSEVEMLWVFYFRSSIQTRNLLSEYFVEFMNRNSIPHNIHSYFFDFFDDTSMPVYQNRGLMRHWLNKKADNNDIDWVVSKINLNNVMLEDLLKRNDLSLKNQDKLIQIILGDKLSFFERRGSVRKLTKNTLQKIYELYPEGIVSFYNTYPAHREKLEKVYKLAVKTLKKKNKKSILTALLSLCFKNKFVIERKSSAGRH